MKNVFLISVFLTSVMANASAPQKGENFEMTGSISHYYGRVKSAESDLWEKALQVCAELSKNESNRLLLNRVSEVILSDDSSLAVSTAQATFICLPVGNAN